ncbi:hypothetical protein CLU79DRAFT_350192 [Phycomyces nitens]|nr:hypothetical protein CLU79DRAFT_350192 [Phycomyces nitens]
MLTVESGLASNNDILLDLHSPSATEVLKYAKMTKKMSLRLTEIFLFIPPKHDVFHEVFQQWIDSRSGISCNQLQFINPLTDWFQR